jgi:hypothetical protein
MSQEERFLPGINFDEFQNVELFDSRRGGINPRPLIPGNDMAERFEDPAASCSPPAADSTVRIFCLFSRFAR